MDTRHEDNIGWIRILVHLSLSIVDLPISAVAGVAAAATGAHMKHTPTTTQILHLGAVAGLIRSGMLNFAALITMASVSTFHYLVVALLVSSFGIALVVTLFVSQKVLGETDTSLIIAAVAAAAPLSAGTVMEQALSPTTGILGPGWDALGGYTFARVAQNHGFHVCEFPTAAGAGAVYGVLSFVLKYPFIRFRDSVGKKLVEKGGVEV